MMPAPRKPTQAAAASSSVQRRNAKPDDASIRTRSGGRGKPAAGTRFDQNTFLSPKSSPINGNSGSLSPTLQRKATRSSSNGSTFSHIAVAGNNATTKARVEWSKPYVIISGLPRDFLAQLSKSPEPEPTPRKEKALARKAQPRSFEYLSATENDDDEADEDVVSESAPSPPPQPAPARRGRGGRPRGRAGRGGRGRGSARKESYPEKPVHVSPKKNRPTRVAAPAFPLTEVEVDTPSNHDSPYESAKESVHHPEEDSSLENALLQHNHIDHSHHIANQNAIPTEDNSGPMEGVEKSTAATSPNDTPPAGLGTPESNPAEKPPPLVRISESQEQNASTPTPNESSPGTPAVEPVQLLDPEDDVLSDSDLPPPFQIGAPKPRREECEEEADYLLKLRYDPLTETGAFLKALEKYPPSARSTENLYELALNTQKALKAFQDEFLKLDQKTAPHQHPPKKPANGGRVPINPAIYEDMKEADLYGYVFDSRKAPGQQDPYAQRLGRDNNGGRELRQRRNRDAMGSAAATEDDEDENEGRGGRRKHRAVQRFDPAGPATGTSTPAARSGWGGARKRGASALLPAASETPEPDSRAKRAKTAANALLPMPQRVQEMREESLPMSTSGDESLAASKRRGRPPGSKNLQKRSDAGIKKGPRKGTSITTAQAPKPAPIVLESLSQGQNQFPIEPRLTPTSQHHVLAPSLAQPVATVFQAAPQPIPTPSHALPPTSVAQGPTPEHFITTTPLSQYGTTPVTTEESTPAGPPAEKKRKQRVKSEKRSQSMTIWWAERKARAAEQKALQQQQQQLAFENADEKGQFRKRPLMGPSPRPSPPPSSSPASLNNSRSNSRAPPSNLIPLNTGLAALPSNPPVNQPGRMPQLAPAPPPGLYHPQPQPPPQFTSPYPNSAPAPSRNNPQLRPKSNPPLAPAPLQAHRRETSGHISPYAPVGPAIGPTMGQHVLGPVGVAGQAPHPFKQNRDLGRRGGI